LPSNNIPHTCIQNRRCNTTFVQEDIPWPSSKQTGYWKIIGRHGVFDNLLPSCTTFILHEGLLLPNKRSIEQRLNNEHLHNHGPWPMLPATIYGLVRRPVRKPVRERVRGLHSQQTGCPHRVDSTRRRTYFAIFGVKVVLFDQGTV